MPGCMCQNFTRNHGTPFVFLSMMKKNNKSSQQHWINVCGSRDASWHARESRNEHVWINVFICLCCYCMFMYNFIYNSLTTSSNAAYTLSSCTHSCGIWQQSHNAFSSSGSTLQMHACKKTQFPSLQKKKKKGSSGTEEISQGHFNHAGMWASGPSSLVEWMPRRAFDKNTFIPFLGKVTAWWTTVRNINPAYGTRALSMRKASRNPLSISP